MLNRKFIYLLILVFMTCIISVGCNKESGIIYLRDESSFGKFEIKENKVYMYNTLTLINYDDKKYSFKIKVNAANEGDLISGEELIAYHMDDISNEIFTISANEKKEYPVVIIGNKGNGDQKNDRLPPEELLIEIID